MAYTAIGLREKKGLSLSQQSSEQITQRFTQYENNSYKANFLIRDTVTVTSQSTKLKTGKQLAGKQVMYHVILLSYWIMVENCRIISKPSREITNDNVIKENLLTITR